MMFDLEKSRPEFEALMLKRAKHGAHVARSHNGVYLDNRVAAKWSAWCAALRYAESQLSQRNPSAP